MIVNVTEVEPQPGSTVWQATGTDTETGDAIRFAGDWRAMEGLYTLVEDFGEVQAEVEGWQILSRTPTYRAATEEETAAWLAGHASFEAVETEHGLQIRDTPEQED